MTKEKTIPSIQLSNGEKLSLISFGTWQLQECTEMVRNAVACGITLIDTASAYRNEEAVAAAVRNEPSIQITSKASPSDMKSFDSVIDACHASCAKLGRDMLDVYLLHWPGVPRHNGQDSVHREKRLSAWKALEQLYHDQKVRIIGVSNFSPTHLEDLLANCKVPPMINQIEIHPLWPDNLCELIAFHQRHRIVLQAYSPLGGGDASNSVREGGLNGTQVLITHPVVQSIAEEVGRTPAQVLLRFLVQQGIAVCFRTTQRERMQENMDIFDWALPCGSLAQLQGLAHEGQKFCWNPERIR